MDKPISGWQPPVVRLAVVQHGKGHVLDFKGSRQRGRHQRACCFSTATATGTVRMTRYTSVSRSEAVSTYVGVNGAWAATKDTLAVTRRCLPLRKPAWTPYRDRVGAGAGKGRCGIAGLGCVFTLYRHQTWGMGGLTNGFAKLMAFACTPGNTRTGKPLSCLSKTLESVCNASEKSP